MTGLMAGMESVQLLTDAVHSRLYSEIPGPGLGEKASLSRGRRWGRGRGRGRGRESTTTRLAGVGVEMEVEVEVDEEVMTAPHCEGQKNGRLSSYS